MRLTGVGAHLKSFSKMVQTQIDRRVRTQEFHHDRLQVKAPKLGSANLVQHSLTHQLS
jgi:hypothetical protein